jgi:acetolactate synthase-1/2/3 large subunit
MFAPLAKWAARIDDAARIPEYVARAYAVATAGRPGPVVLALPEDMLCDVVEATDRPRVTAPVQAPDRLAIEAVWQHLRTAKAPLAIVGGAGWTADAGAIFAAVAERYDLPVAVAFRRQDAIASDSPVYAGNLGYGPNPKLVARVKAADVLLVVGPRLGEATTDGYTLVTPDHPGQILIHVHPDPAEPGRVYRPDLAICAGMEAFASELAALDEPLPEPARIHAAHAEWEAWNTPAPNGRALDLGLCVATMRDRMPADTIICNGAGNYSGWWHRFWRYGPYGTQLAPTNGSMGYGVPAAVAASRRHPDRRVVALAGDGCFLMNGQELATAVAHDCRMLVIVVDNGTYGTIRMHQEREYPARVSGTSLVNPNFAALARAYGGWAATVETTDAFGPALDEALAQPGLALLHLKTEAEQIAPAVTITQLRLR